MALLHNYTKEELAEMSEAFEADKKAFLEGSYTAIYNYSIRTKVIYSFLTQEEKEEDFNTSVEFFMFEFFKDEEKPYLENSQYYGYDVKATRLCQYFMKTVLAINEKHFKELDSVKAIVEDAHNLISKAIELAFYRFNNELKKQRDLLNFAKENKEILIERERKNIFKATGGKPETFNETPEEAYINNWLTPLDKNITTLASGNAGNVQLEFLLPCPQNTILIDRYSHYDGDTTETEPQGYFINLQDMRKLLKDHILYRHFKALEELDPEEAEQLESYLNNVLRKSPMIQHKTYKTQSNLTGITHLPGNLYNPTTEGTKHAFDFITPERIGRDNPEKAFVAIKKSDIAPDVMNFQNGLYKFEYGFDGFEVYFLSHEALEEFTRGFDPTFPYIFYTALIEKYKCLSPEQIDRIPYTAIVSWKEIQDRYELDPRRWNPINFQFEVNRTWGQAIGIIDRGYSYPDAFTFIHVDYDSEKDVLIFTTPFIKALIRQEKGIRIDEARKKLPIQKQKNIPDKELDVNPIASLNVKGSIIKAKDKIGTALLYRLDRTIATVGEHIGAFKLLTSTPSAFYEYQRAKNKTRFLQRHFIAMFNYINEYTAYYDKLEGFTISAYENDDKKGTYTTYIPGKELEEQPGLIPTQRNLKKLVYEFNHKGIEEAKEKKSEKKPVRKKRR